MNWEIPDIQARFRKGRGTRDQIANIRWIIEKAREFQNIYFCFIDYAKACDCVYHNKLWKSLKEMGLPDHVPWNLYAGQEATVRTVMEQWAGSKLGKEYVKAVYYYLAYLTYMHRTSCEKLDWMKHKLESRLLGEISTNLDMQMTSLIAESEEEPKSLLMNRWEWKNWLKTLYSNTKIMAFGPIISH